MDGKENLKSLRDRTPEEKKRIASMGAIAKNKEMRRRKLLREELKALLQSTLDDEELIESLKKNGVKVTSGETMQSAITIALVLQAANGNVKAFEIIRDTIGEKPVDKVEANVNDDGRKLLKDYLDKMKQ